MTQAGALAVCLVQPNTHSSPLGVCKSPMVVINGCQMVAPWNAWCDMKQKSHCGFEGAVKGSHLFK